MARRSAIPVIDPMVAEVLESYPRNVRRKLVALRRLIFETAKSTDGVGEITETLKWGQPAYLTAASRSGTTIRLGWSESDPFHFRMYVHCQTDLVPTFRLLFQDTLSFEGNRAVVLEASEPLPSDCLATCIETALTYRRDKKSTRKK